MFIILKLKAIRDALTVTKQKICVDNSYPFQSFYSRKVAETIK